MTDTALQHWPLDRLTPYSKNARTHSAEQVDQIAKSIEAFGFVGAVVVRDGTLAKGHGTLEAVRLMYGNGKSVYPAPGAAAGAVAYPAGTIPVLEVTGWTDAQFRAFVLADNRIALSGGWDEGILAFELDELRDAEFDMSVIGFAPGELNDLIGTPNTGFDPDEVPPAPVDPVSRTGDLWVMGASVTCPKCKKTTRV